MDLVEVERVDLVLLVVVHPLTVLMVALVCKLLLPVHLLLLA